MTKKEEIQKLVDEMTPNVLLYVETLMEHYEKLESENLELKQQLLEKRCSDKDIEYQEKIKLQNRIDKSIEYITEYRNGWNNWFEFTINDKIKLLEILKGEKDD